MPLRTLKAPEGHLSVSVGGTQFNVDDEGLIRDIDDGAAALIQDHDPRFIDHKPGAALSGEGSGVDQPAREAINRLGARVHDLDGKVDQVAQDAQARSEELASEVAEMGRNMLFADLKSMGVVVSRTLKTDELREIWVTETAKAEEAAGNLGSDPKAGEKPQTEPAKPE